MDYFPDSSGTASALLGFSQFGIAGGVSAFSTGLPGGIVAITGSQLACVLIAAFLLYRLNNVGARLGWKLPQNLE